MHKKRCRVEKNSSINVHTLSICSAMLGNRVFPARTQTKHHIVTVTNKYQFVLKRKQSSTVSYQQICQIYKRRRIRYNKITARQWPNLDSIIAHTRDIASWPTNHFSPRECSR